jgi:phosphatidylinositol kinase/protein kinase (PI-3  family)
MTKNMENVEMNKLKTIMETGDFQGRRVLGKFYDKIGININYALYHFFLNSNSDIIKCWWAKYTNFIRTYAQWSYLCYLVGLGDRHSNNILVNQ